MTFYPAPSPYRSSTGSMPVPIQEPNSSSSPRRERSSRKHEDRQEHKYSSSHDDGNPTLKLNTPFSSTPRQSSHSLQPPSPDHRGTRRSSHSGGEHPRILTRYPHGALIMEPAYSLSGGGGGSGSGERRRRSSVSSPSVAGSSAAALPRSHARRSWQSYQNDIDIEEEDTVRPGTTRIPRKLVNRAAAEQSGLPFEEERGTGAIVFKRALPRGEIERLVETTEAIRSRHAGKKPEQKKEKHVRIIPHPTEEIPAEEPGSHSHSYGHGHSHGKTYHASGHHSRSYHSDASPRSSSLKVAQSDNEGRGGREYRTYSGGRSSKSEKDSGNHSDSGATRAERRRVEKGGSGEQEYRPHTLRYGPNGQREIVIVR